MYRVLLMQHLVLSQYQHHFQFQQLVEMVLVDILLLLVLAALVELLIVQLALAVRETLPILDHQVLQME
jgi:hypothetical protein